VAGGDSAVDRRCRRIENKDAIAIELALNLIDNLS
jgi:hypothetical protein